MVGSERQQLAEALNLSETQVSWVLSHISYFRTFPTPLYTERELYGVGDGEWSWGEGGGE